MYNLFICFFTNAVKIAVVLKIAPGRACYLPIEAVASVCNLLVIVPVIEII